MVNDCKNPKLIICISKTGTVYKTSDKRKRPTTTRYYIGTIRKTKTYTAPQNEKRLYLKLVRHFQRVDNRKRRPSALSAHARAERIIRDAKNANKKKKK